MSDRTYTKPDVTAFGTVDELTEQNDKIGSADDGADFEGLDGTIVED